MGGVRRVDSDDRRQVVAPSADRELAALAGGQYGVVGRAQLLALGLGASAIDRRVASGRLHVVHRGVYAVGHQVLGPRGRWMAAVLAGGEGAVLSHRSAGALWEIRFSSARYPDVSVPRAGGHKRPGIRFHRAASLRPSEVTVKDGIPVTTPARTVLDLAVKLGGRPLEKVLDRTELLELADYPALRAMARAHPSHRGAPELLRTLNTHHAGTTLTKSELEERFLALCRAHNLPTPLANTWPSGKEVDFRFPGHDLIVEADSWTHHRSRAAFENDHARDAHHALAGYRTLRFTHRQLADEPATVAATIAAILARATDRAA
jgi:putative AbiEi antitoxin of type IV toxin-antitoxin system/uncharacterized protein DUF559